MPDRQQREEQHATRSQPLQGRDDQDLHVSSAKVRISCQGIQKYVLEGLTF